jgi:hypothetical protein
MKSNTRSRVLSLRTQQPHALNLFPLKAIPRRQADLQQGVEAGIVFE